MPYIIGVDVGGTFTDAFAADGASALEWYAPGVGVVRGSGGELLAELAGLAEGALRAAEAVRFLEEHAQVVLGPSPVVETSGRPGAWFAPFVPNGGFVRMTSKRLGPAGS